MRRLLFIAILAMASAAPVCAQRLGPPEQRPRLPAGADTSDSQAYYDFGVNRFERNPDDAAAAFYWAARLNPASGDALYARRAALLMKDASLLRRVMEGNRRTMESDEVRRLDSLQFRALMLSPFLFRKLDRPMFVTYIRNSVTGIGRQDASPELEYAIDNYLRTAGSSMRGWLAYSDGNFDAALRNYADAMGNARDKAPLRLDRARIFGLKGQVDSATAEFNKALEEMRKKDQKDLVIFYNSKALVEYSIGVLLEGADSTQGAREAYGRALQEDLSYYPAHMRLGLLSLGLKDTTTAMSEMALAVDIAPTEPHIRYVNGFVLIACGRYVEAEKELRKAVELEPYYAMPYLRLGQTYEQLGKGKEAADAFEGFLARASAMHPERAYAREKLTEIKEFLAAVPAKP